MTFDDKDKALRATSMSSEAGKRSIVDDTIKKQEELKVQLHLTTLSNWQPVSWLLKDVVKLGSRWTSGADVAFLSLEAGILQAQIIK